MSTVDHLRAAAVLVVLSVMVLLAFPGLDVATEKGLERADTQAAMARHLPDLAQDLVEAVVLVNTRVRMPIVEQFTPIERVFRIRQNWSVYRSGPREVGRVEVWVDGELVYRSADPEHAWRRSWFSNRHLRPPVQGLVTRGRRGPNTPGVRRLIATLAARDFPDARKITVVGTTSAFPGTSPRPRYRGNLSANEVMPW